MNKRNLIGIIILIAIITIIIGIGIISSLPNNDDTNITLNNVETFGHTFVSSDNQEYYYYNLKGVFKNLPSNLHDYTLKSTFYGTDGEYLHQTTAYNLGSIAENPSMYNIANWESTKYYNVSKIELIITNPDGNIVFNETYDFNMEKMDLTGLDKKNSNSSSNK